MLKRETNILFDKPTDEKEHFSKMAEPYDIRIHAYDFNNKRKKKLLSIV